MHVEVSLSKILNPRLLLMSSWHLAWQPLPAVYECVCEWVNLTSVVKWLWAVSRLQKRYRNESPFSIMVSVTAAGRIILPLKISEQKLLIYFHWHYTAICGTVSITVSAATSALWLKHEWMKPISSSRTAANSAWLLSPYKSLSSLHLWNDTQIFILALIGCVDPGVVDSCKSN